MKQILSAVFVLFLHHALHAQMTVPAVLDYSNYHIAFQDDFKAYSDTLGAYPTTDFSINTSSTYYKAFHKFWTTDFGDYNPNGDVLFTPQTSTSTVGCVPMQPDVIMSAPGEIQLTVYVLPVACHTLYSTDSPRQFQLTGGGIITANNYGYGIIEASMKISGDVTQKASTAFWMRSGGGTNATEIDILDYSHDIYSIQRVIDGSYHDPANHVIDNQHYAPSDLSTAYHLYSVAWTPLNVSFYIDSALIKVVPYTDVRTYPNFQSFAIAMQPVTGVTDGLSMYVNSFKIWRRDCNATDLTDVGTLTYPVLTGLPNAAIVPGLYKYQTINSTVSTGVAIETDFPTIFESEATIINSNFIADETTSITSASVVYEEGVKTEIGNGFFEMLPLKCGADNKSDDAWYRQAAGAQGTSPGTTPVMSNMKYNNLGNRYAGSPGSVYDSVLTGGSNNQDNKPDNISVYPNPAHNNITINYPVVTNGVLSVEMKDVAGRSVYSKQVASTANSTTEIIDISTLAQGVYFLDVKIGRWHAMNRIVKL